MNALREAAQILSTGHWCSGDLHSGEGRKDRHCALGALGAVLYEDQYLVDKVLEKNSDIPDEIIVNNPNHHLIEDVEYELLADEKAVEVLAKTIIEQNPEWVESDTYVAREIEEGNWSEIVVAFNDRQESYEPVVAMFEKAAVKWDEQA